MDRKSARKAATAEAAPLAHLTPGASRLARRAGGYATLAAVGAEAMTSRLRAGRMAKARAAVDPEGALDAEERERRAEAYVQAQQYRSLARAQQARAERRVATEKRAARLARSPEARARLAVDTERREQRATRQQRQRAYWGAADAGDTRAMREATEATER